MKHKTNKRNKAGSGGKHLRQNPFIRVHSLLTSDDGMELVQVAILVAIAIVIGLIFRAQIEKFVQDVFSGLTAGKFS